MNTKCFRGFWVISLLNMQCNVVWLSILRRQPNMHYVKIFSGHPAKALDSRTYSITDHTNSKHFFSRDRPICRFLPSENSYNPFQYCTAAQKPKSDSTSKCLVPTTGLQSLRPNRVKRMILKWVPYRTPSVGRRPWAM